MMIVIAYQAGLDLTLLFRVKYKTSSASLEESWGTKLGKQTNNVCKGVLSKVSMFAQRQTDPRQGNLDKLYESQPDLEQAQKQSLLSKKDSSLPPHNFSQPYPNPC